MSKVILYKTRRIVSLTQGGLTIPNWNFPMNEPDFRVYKGTKSNVDFVIRNTDRKPINIENKTLVATIVDVINKKTIIQLPLEVINGVKGLARLSFSPEFTNNLPIGFLQYSISILDENGNLELLFMDQYDQAKGPLEVLEGVMPEPKNCYFLSPENFYPSTQGTYPETILISNNLPGNLQNGNVYGLHTIMFDIDNFKGKIWVQGTLDIPETQSLNEWFNLQLNGFDYLKYNGETIKDAFNIISNLYWVRVIFNPDDDNHGEIKRIYFRN